jgi:hypothetical protein
MWLLVGGESSRLDAFEDLVVLLIGTKVYIICM